ANTPFAASTQLPTAVCCKSHAKAAQASWSRRTMLLVKRAVHRPWFSTATAATVTWRKCGLREKVWGCRRDEVAESERQRTNWLNFVPVAKWLRSDFSDAT